MCCKLIYIITKNTLAAEMLWPRPEKGCDEKDVKSKGGGKACVRMLSH